jgi:hypothetical protein
MDTRRVDEVFRSKDGDKDWQQKLNAIWENLDGTLRYDNGLLISSESLDLDTAQLIHGNLVNVKKMVDKIFEHKRELGDSWKTFIQEMESLFRGETYKNPLFTAKGIIKFFQEQEKKQQRTSNSSDPDLKKELDLQEFYKTFSRQHDSFIYRFSEIMRDYLPRS